MRFVVTCFILPLLAAFLGAGCAHTNNLQQYQLSGKTFFAEERVEHDASRIEVSFDAPPGVRANPITGILIAIGEGITSAEAEKRFQRAIKPEGVAAAVARGFERDLKNYLDLTRSNDPYGKAEFILRTRLEELKLHSGAGGVYLKIKTNVTLIDRLSAGIVWENEEDAEYPIRRTEGAEFIPGVATGASIANAVELLKLPDDQIQDAVLRTAEEVGFLMGETLREDVAKGRK